MCGCSGVNCSPNDNRFNAIASNPIDRLIRVHAKSLAHAKQRNHCDEVAPACCESDARQCRIIINALRREIDRLLRGIDPRRPFWVETQASRPADFSADRIVATSQEADFARRASAQTTRPIYAPPSIGDRTAITQALSSTASSSNTSLPANQAVGQLIDVLA